MAKVTSKYCDYIGEAFYAKLFESDRDDSEYHEATGGQYNMIFIPTEVLKGGKWVAGTNEEMVKSLIKDGFPEEILGHSQIKEYSIADGRKGIKLKRPHKHQSIEDFGGAPHVFNWTENKNEPTSKKWDREVDGAIGNGSEVRVKFVIWKTTVRLESVAILTHVPYEESELKQIGW